MWQAGVGDGRIRVMERLQDMSPEIRGETIRRLETLREQAQSVGGALIIEDAPAEIKTRVNAWGTFGSSAGVMRRIKTQLDPNCILSPGRFDFETTPVSRSHPASAG
jgi:hypothetical protein